MNAGNMSVGKCGVEEDSGAEMCDWKEEQDEEVMIVEVRMNNDQKEREMERRSERKDGRISE